MGGIANGVFEAAAILLIVPLIVSIGAGSDIRHKKSIAICRFLGGISYPLYITHLPLIYMQMAWISNHPNASHSSIIMLSVSVFFISLALSYACLRLYDVPVRTWLGKHWLSKK